MRIAVEQWSPEYGSPADDLEDSDATVHVDVEVAAGAWAPRPPVGPASPCTLFVDGVRRVDARAWITDDDGVPHQALLASYGAGVVRSNGGAAVVDHHIGRALCTAVVDADDLVTTLGTWRVAHATSEDDPLKLSLAVQQRMTAAEAVVAARVLEAAPDAALVVVDGPLRAGATYPDVAVGYVKTHSRDYLRADHPDEAAFVAALAPGERTPVFLIDQARAPRHAWYLRLPGPLGHPWAGVVRCECAAGDARSAIALSDLTAATLPRFASVTHKDPRAPQNLIPIGALEQRLRHLLGDRDLLYRSLLRATATSATA